MTGQGPSPLASTGGGSTPPAAPTCCCAARLATTRLVLALKTLPPLIFVPSTQSEPRREVLDGGELGHVRARLRNHSQRSRQVHPVDARRVHRAHLEQLSAQTELRRIAGSPALFALGRFTVLNFEGLHLLLDLRVALGQLRTDEIECPQRLLEGKQVLSAPSALQAPGDLLDAGAHAHVLHRAQHPAVTFPGHDGTQDLQARLADDVGPVGQADSQRRGMFGCSIKSGAAVGCRLPPTLCVSVVVSQLCEQESVAFDLVDHPVFFIDST